MLNILLVLFVGVAQAHRAFGPATLHADSAAIAAQRGDLTADEIEKAITGLDRAIQFASLRLTECGRHLLADRWRNDPGPYTAFMTEYHGLLLEYRELFVRLAAGENVPAADLDRLRNAARDCARRAHGALLGQVR